MHHHIPLTQFVYNKPLTFVPVLKSSHVSKLFNKVHKMQCT